MFSFLKKKVEAAPPSVRKVNRVSDLAGRVIEALGVADDDTILQIGFDDADVIFHLLPLVPRGRVAGVDADPAKVWSATQTMPEEYRSFKVDFKEGVASRLPYPAEHFTKVFALDSVAAWLSIPKGLSEIKRVLFPLGRVAFSLPPKESTGIAFVPVVEVKALMRDAGFVNIEVLEAADAEVSVIVMGQKPL